MLAAVGSVHGATGESIDEAWSQAKIERSLDRLTWVTDTVGDERAVEVQACAELRLGARWPSMPPEAWLPQQEAAVREAIESCNAVLSAAAAAPRSAGPGKPAGPGSEGAPLRLVAEIGEAFQRRLRELSALRDAFQACDIDARRSVTPQPLYACVAQYVRTSIPFAVKD